MNQVVDRRSQADVMNEVVDRRRRADRRKSPRYVVAPADAEALVGWWDGADFRTEVVRAQDISSGGVRLSVTRPVVPSQEIWLTFVAAPTPDWLPGRVVATVQNEEQHTSIRVAFSSECPYEVIRTVAWGGTTSNTRARSFRLASESLSFRVAREETTPVQHRSFRLTMGPGGGQHSAKAPQPLPLPESPPDDAVAAVIRRGPPALTESLLSTRRDRDRLELMAVGVRFLAAASIMVVIAVLITREYGKIRPLSVIAATLSD
jgi:hypothetical protein